MKTSITSLFKIRLILVGKVGLGRWTRVLSLMALASTSALAGPCDTGDSAGCSIELSSKMDGSAGVTSVKSWNTTNSVASAYWFLNQIHNGFAVYGSLSKQYPFLIAVDAKSITKDVKRGATLLDSVDCLKWLGETDMPDDHGFNVKVRLFRQVECK